MYVILPAPICQLSHASSKLMSPGLQRAREPFRIRNAVTGTLLLSFAVGIWAYSISAVKQDVFDDVDEEARALAKAREKSLEEQEAERRAAEGLAKAVAAPDIASMTPVQPAERTPSVASVSTAGRGVLPALLDQRFPRMLDPTTKTFVWGAPSVDSIGKWWDGTRRRP